VAVVGIALDRAARGRGLLSIAAIPVASAVAAALTPVGPALYPAVLLVGSRGKYFAEWQPTNFLRVSGVALLLLAAAVLLRMLRRRTAISWTEALLVCLAGGWAVYTNRTVTVAAMMLVPLAARVYADARTPRVPRGRGESTAVVVGFAVCLAALAVAVPRTADHPPEDPEWAEVVDGLPAGTAVVNDWGMGGWMMWRWPDLNFVMNGYGDIFTDAELERNNQLETTSSGWIAAVKETGARYALLEPGTGLSYGLEQEGWTIEHRSDDLLMMEAPPDWAP
jgi:hypothetical protein